MADETSVNEYVEAVMKELDGCMPDGPMTRDETLALGAFAFFTGAAAALDQDDMYHPMTTEQVAQMFARPDVRNEMAAQFRRVADLIISCEEARTRA